MKHIECMLPDAARQCPVRNCPVCGWNKVVKTARAEKRREAEQHEEEMRVLRSDVDCEHQDAGT